MSDYFYSLEMLLLKSFRGEFGFNTLAVLTPLMYALPAENNQ